MILYCSWETFQSFISLYPQIPEQFVRTFCNKPTQMSHGCKVEVFYLFFSVLNWSCTFLSSWTLRFFPHSSLWNNSCTFRLDGALPETSIFRFLLVKRFPQDDTSTTVFQNVDNVFREMGSDSFPITHKSALHIGKKLHFQIEQSSNMSAVFLGFYCAVCS